MSISGDRIKKMLPKTYLRKLVAHEIRVALLHFTDLKPVMGRYVYNDGSTKSLMSLTGTIPVRTQEETYNIPVCLWIEESYPRTAPICYIMSTCETQLVRGKYISSNWEVVLPYLDEWKAGECDLVSVLQVIAAMFGDDPPVCGEMYSSPEELSYWLHYNGRANVLTKLDGSKFLFLATDDGPHLQEGPETSC